MQLMQGTSAIMAAMEPWKHESSFVDFINESSTFPTAPSSPRPDQRANQPDKEALDAYQATLEQIQKVETHLKHQGEGHPRMDTTQIQNLASFLKGSRKIGSNLPISQQFERLKSLRDWLFWMPVGYLQNYRCSPNSLLAIAHLYTVALLMERLFPEIGSAYFGSLSVTPIEEISRRMMAHCMHVEGGNDAGAPLKLMSFPIDAVGEFRSRMGWTHPERTQSFPQFNPPNFPVPVYQESPQSYEDSSYVLYGNPAFSYSAESMPVLNASVSHAQSPATPLVLASPYPSQQYLSIPSPMYPGAYSPASSTFEGSVTYSDNEDFSWELNASQQSPMFDHHSFGAGFVSPNSHPVWI